jgi:hypothetical protein
MSSIACPNETTSIAWSLLIPIRLSPSSDAIAIADAPSETFEQS